jgi:hypothetical protein
MNMLATSQYQPRLSSITNVVPGRSANQIAIQLYFICFIRWASGKWLPQKDTQQNVQVVSGSYNNKMATVSFIRKRNTGDTSKDIMSPCLLGNYNFI